MSPLGWFLTMAILGVDDLSPARVGGLGLRAPAAWQHSAPDANTQEWSAPGGGAKLALSAFALEKPLAADECLRKLLDAVGATGFERLTVGAQPAAKKVTSDFVGEGIGARVDSNRVTTTTFMGCDGRVKWVLTYTAKTASAARFGAVLKRVVDSISFGRAP